MICLFGITIVGLYMYVLINCMCCYVFSRLEGSAPFFPGRVRSVLVRKGTMPAMLEKQ